MSQVDLLGFVGESRAGARTVSTTLPHTAADQADATENQGVFVENFDIVNPDHTVEGGVAAEREVHDEHELPQNDMRNVGQLNTENIERQRDTEIVDRRDFVRARQAARGREQRSIETQHAEHQPVAWVAGGLVYSPTERTLTVEQLRRHNMATRSRSRSRSRGPNRRQPDSVGSSSALSEVRLMSTAWPRTPPPAQPDLLVKPVFDDVGPVGTLSAFPTADVTEVTMDLSPTT